MRPAYTGGRWEVADPRITRLAERRQAAIRAGAYADALRLDAEIGRITREVHDRDYMARLERGTHGP